MTVWHVLGIATCFQPTLSRSSAPRSPAARQLQQQVACTSVFAALFCQALTGGSMAQRCVEFMTGSSMQLGQGRALARRCCCVLDDRTIYLRQLACWGAGLTSSSILQQGALCTLARRVYSLHGWSHLGAHASPSRAWRAESPCELPCFGACGVLRQPSQHAQPRAERAKNTRRAQLTCALRAPVLHAQRWQRRTRSPRRRGWRPSPSSTVVPVAWLPPASSSPLTW